MAEADQRDKAEVYRSISLESYSNPALTVGIEAIFFISNEKTTEEFHNIAALERFVHQLKIYGDLTNHTMKPDFSWACANVDKIINKYEIESKTTTIVDQNRY